MVTAATLLALSAAAQGTEPLTTDSTTAQQEPDKESFIEVRGTAKMKVEPNEIEIRIILRQEGMNEKVPVDRQQNNLMRDLTAAGIPATERLRIDNVSNSLKEAFLRRDEVRTIKQLTLILHNTAELAEAFTILNQLGISDASITKATRNDFEEIKQELRAKAIENARAMADTLASAIGQRAGRAFYINDNGYMSGEGGATTRFMSVMKASNLDSVANEAAPIADNELEFNKLELEYSINAKFYLY